MAAMQKPSFHLSVYWLQKMPQSLHQKIICCTKIVAGKNLKKNILLFGRICQLSSLFFENFKFLVNFHLTFCLRIK